MADHSITLSTVDAGVILCALRLFQERVRAARPCVELDRAVKVYERQVPAFLSRFVDEVEHRNPSQYREESIVAWVPVFGDGGV